MIKARKDKKTVFNIIDIIIIAIFIIFLSYFIYSYVLGNSLYNIGAEKVQLEYNLRIDKVKASYCNNIKEGDIIKTSDGKLVLGRVVSSTSEISDDGMSYTVYVTVQADAYMRKNLIFNIQNQKLKPDMAISIRFPNYYPHSAVITDIKVV